MVNSVIVPTCDQNESNFGCVRLSREQGYLLAAVADRKPGQDLNRFLSSTTQQVHSGKLTPLEFLTLLRRLEQVESSLSNPARSERMIKEMRLLSSPLSAVILEGLDPKLGGKPLRKEFIEAGKRLIKIAEDHGLNNHGDESNFAKEFGSAIRESLRAFLAVNGKFDSTLNRRLKEQNQPPIQTVLKKYILPNK